jgi:deoxyribodipyrimidine photolyase-related protein
VGLRVSTNDTSSTGGTTAWVLGDQLSAENPVLADADRVLLVEAEGALGAKRYHRQKLHLIWSAMRHFAEELRHRDITVDYRRGSTYAAAVAEHRREFAPETIRLLDPTSLRVGARLAAIDGVELVPGSLFLTTPDEFAVWSQGRRRLVMEDFYRWQRRRLDVLMEGDEPVGGVWNLDKENRRPPSADHRPPPVGPREDDIDRAVRADLDTLAPDAFGEAGPRIWPATRDEALAELDAFVQERLPDFGRWQDAMIHGERWMWHSRLASSLNIGLLTPLECVRAVEAAYYAGNAPLNAVEGFVRQVIGWREYVWGIYRLRGWTEVNALRATGPVPAPLLDGKTAMRCVDDTMTSVRETGYAHHIQRLMILGNLMLLLGTRPQVAAEWFHASFVDGYAWVMAPNAIGMATFGDGGRLMTKPYAASGRYVHKMSNYCKPCQYRPGERVGPRACPFTTLYWDFMDRNRPLLSKNRRMAPILGNLDRFPPEELDDIRQRSAELRENFDA